MRFAGSQSFPDLGDEYGSLLFGNQVFSFLWRFVRVEIFKFLRGDKIDFIRQDLFYIIVTS